MPAHRVPGPMGLRPDEDPFPPHGGSWEHWPSRVVLPKGAAADAHYDSNLVGLNPEDLAATLPEPETTPAEYKPIERFRYMEVQGQVYKVRCIPLWQGRFSALLDGTDEDDKAQEKLVRAVKAHPGQKRAEIVSFCMNQLEEEGRHTGPTAGRLAEIPVSEPEEDGEASINGEGGRRPVYG